MIAFHSTEASSAAVSDDSIAKEADCREVVEDKSYTDILNRCHWREVVCEFRVEGAYTCT